MKAVWQKIIKKTDIFAKKVLHFYKKYGKIINNCGFSAIYIKEQSSAMLRTNVLLKEEPKMEKIQAFVSEQIKKDVPQFAIGDTVKVYNKIKEGTRERIQLFEGTVIAKHNGGISETFTVRRISYGCGHEKTFPLHSPNVEKVEVVRSGKVRRAKLYYLRDKVGKDAKVKEKI